MYTKHTCRGQVSVLTCHFRLLDSQTFGESPVFASHLEMAMLELRMHGGVREIAHWLRALVILAEDLDWVPTPTW